MKKIFAFVFARGGSKGLPKKNIKVLRNHPLIGHSILVAKKVAGVERVFVSTDDSEIASVAESYGAEVINRPADLARDDSPEWLAWKHAVEYSRNKYGNFDIFLSVPTTAPLREAVDLQNCVDLLSSGANFDVVITVTESRRSPWFNMVKVNDEKTAQLLIGGDERITRRQDAPKAYDITTVAYAVQPDFIMKARGVFDGKVGAVEVPEERAVDIDTVLDFKLAEVLMAARGT